MAKYLTLLILLILSVELRGQIDTSKVNQSPHGVIYNHLYFLQKENYIPSRAALSIPEEYEERERLALQLKKILDGKGYYVDINRLPTNANFKDSLTKESIYFIDRDEPRIYVEKIGNQWYYSRTTMDHIPKLFKEVFPLGTSFIHEFKGAFWHTEFFGITVLKWFGLILLLVSCGILFFVVNRLVRLIGLSFIRRRIKFLRDLEKDFRKFSRLLGLLAALHLLLYLLPSFQIPIRLNALLIKSLGILNLFFLVLVVIQISNFVFHYLETVVEKTVSKMDDQLLPVLRRVVSVIIWIIGAIYILDYLDVNITALLAGISIGGLAIALAAQDTVKNFFGSLMIFIDRPFQIGDWIHFDNVDGVVEEVGFRSTRIRTFANSLVYVPNGYLADKVVDNMGLRQYRRYKTELSITYNTPPKKIDLFVKGIRAIIEQHPETRKDYFEVHLNSLASSSINILLYCFFKASDWTEELEGRHQIIYAILTLADDIGVQFAFPTQSLYVEALPDSKKEAKIPKELEVSLRKINKYFAMEDVEIEDGKIKPLGGE